MKASGGALCLECSLAQRKQHRGLGSEYHSLRGPPAPGVARRWQGALSGTSASLSRSDLWPKLMRILSVIQSMGRGGAEQLLANILPELQARGHVCEIAVLMPPYVVADSLEESGVAVHRLNLSHPRSAGRAISQLAKLCRRGRFDIVHAHLLYPAMYTAITRLFVPSPRRVVTFHAPDYAMYPSNTTLKRLQKATHMWLMRWWTDGWIAVSQQVKRHYEEQFGLKGIQVIYNAIPVGPLHPLEGAEAAAVRARYGVSASDFFLITPARFRRPKGQEFLLRALPSLRERGLRPKLLLAGGGPLAGQLSGLVESLALKDQVNIHESIPHEELLLAIQAADALVLPSLQEGFGVAAAEGMALEKPVVATSVFGLKELVEEGISGLLVAPADPAALAEGIARLMGDAALRERLGKAGRQRVKALFSTEVVLEQWESYYQSLLANGRRN
jgi:glycosyltransferase involved in cell wall biosynthesis